MILQRAWRGYAAPWFRSRYVSTFFESVGALLDTEAQRVLDGRLAAIPYAGSDPGGARLATGRRIECQPDALPYHATDRDLTLYASEPLRSQRVRLSQWRQLHARRGTHRGELEHLQPYFLGPLGTYPVPTIQIVHTTGQYGGAAALSTWYRLTGAGYYTVQRRSSDQWDVNPSSTNPWSDFDVIIYGLASGGAVPSLAGQTYYDGAHGYGDGQTYDGASAQVVADIRSMVQAWHSAHSRLRWIIVDDSETLGPDLTLSTDASGWTNIPAASNWLSLVYPSGTYAGHNTRPPNLRWLYDANAVEV